MFRRLLFSLLSILVIGTLATAVILYGRGYRFDPQAQKVSTTGILSVSSYPEKASIYIDGKLASATDASLTLPPGWFEVEVKKDGYQSWKKSIRVQGEVVSQIDALLIPNNPSFRALTTTGVSMPVLSHSGAKVAYVVTGNGIDPVTLKSKNGIYVMELKSGPLGNQPSPKQVFTDTRGFDYANAKIHWSADEKELVLVFTAPGQETQSYTEGYLVSVDNPQLSPVNITLRIENILAEWQDELKLEMDLKLESLPLNLGSFLATNAATLKFSPDDSKILYQASASATLAQIIDPPLIGVNPTEEIREIRPENVYLYDVKEDRNYLLAENPEVLPVWYTDSKHLLTASENRINIMDYDGNNRRTVYSGPFSNGLVFPWSPGEKIVILTNFNTERPLPDLYEIDLR